MKKTKSTPTADYVRECLDYDHETGKFIWRERPASHFHRYADFLAWNAKFSGRPAMSTSRPDGYLAGSIQGWPHPAHRIAWVHANGYWPHEIDHINGVRSDNRLSNLREVTRKENSENHALAVTNTSGATGVFFHKASGRWYSKIAHKYLGMSATFEEALAMRKAAELEHGYHPNHGRLPVN